MNIKLQREFIYNRVVRLHQPNDGDSYTLKQLLQYCRSAKEIKHLYDALQLGMSIERNASPLTIINANGCPTPSQ